LHPEDFESVHKVYENFSVIKLNKIGQKKFEGAQQVAVPMRSLASMNQTKQAELVKNLLQTLKKEAKAKGKP